ncbi:hypothetical protein F8388_005402 [Cannabis sativa]|uniref:Isopenicillin N synthase-like Fe(2+) 2OG dioxygenase domain-containing protein n=1 Tax=Cannabis sativa TaxID=3483 RepID=A0A7J6EHS9_CANSA|nr:hypothetical protein F8388_005402 [Cannabis sativa]
MSSLAAFMKVVASFHLDIMSIMSLFLGSTIKLLISNGKFKSVEHRVLANSTSPRISVAYFFTTHFEESEKFYGPIKELVTYESPPLYKETSFRTCSVTEGERSKPVLKQNITMGSIS